MAEGAKADTQIGVILAAAIGVFMATGAFTLWDAMLGLILFGYLQPSLRSSSGLLVPAAMAVTVVLITGIAVEAISMAAGASRYALLTVHLDQAGSSIIWLQDYSETPWSSAHHFVVGLRDLVFFGYWCTLTLVMRSVRDR